MTTVLLGAAGFLLLNVVVSLWRVVVGPGTRDRLAGLLLMGTTGAIVLVVLAEALAEPALRDAALGIVTLAALAVVVRSTSEASRDLGGGRA